MPSAPVVTVVQEPRVALVTAAALRVGRAIAVHLHQAGFNLLLHCGRSVDQASLLADELNAIRADSATVIQANLADDGALEHLATIAREASVCFLVNNAARFDQVPVAQADARHWDEVLAVNSRAPYLLSRSLYETLAAQQGSIVNISDGQGDRPTSGYPVYSVSKAALSMLTRTLALEFAPHVRVNAVAPGAILWPPDWSEAQQQAALDRIPLARIGTPEDIAGAVTYLAQAPFVTGQTLTIDGGAALT